MQHGTCIQASFGELKPIKTGHLAKKHLFLGGSKWPLKRSQRQVSALVPRALAGRMGRKKLRDPAICLKGFLFGSRLFFNLNTKTSICFAQMFILKIIPMIRTTSRSSRKHGNDNRYSMNIFSVSREHLWMVS